MLHVYAKGILRTSLGARNNILGARMTYIWIGANNGAWLLRSVCMFTSCSVYMLYTNILLTSIFYINICRHPFPDFCLVNFLTALYLIL